MYAPSGVDSDTSSGEPDIPDSPPKEFGNKPHFSLKSLFQPARKLIDPLRKPDGADDVKQLRAVQAVEAESTPAKKRVRIVVDGEPEEPFKTLRSPREPMDQAFGKARLSPVIQNEATTSGPRPNESSAELLTTLRELIAESATNRQTLLPAQPPSNERRESPTFLHPIPKRRPTPFQPASERSSELESDARREQTSPLLTMKPERGHPQLRGQPSRPGNLELRYDTDPDVDAPSAGQAPEVGDPVPTQLAKPSHGHIPWLALRTPPSHADDSRAPPSLHTKEITSAPPVDQLYLSTAGEQAIPPLSYQPLRAYHLPRNGSSPQVYHPAEGDQWTQPGSAPPSHQHPRHDPSREACSHQPPPFENAAPSLHFYYQAQYAYPSDMQHGYTAQQSFYAGHPPPTYVLVQPPPISPYMISPPSPVYFQTVSLQRWQPYYPTLPDSNAQHPLSQHASVHETEYSFHREPASAPVRPSEPWPSGGNDQRLDRSPMPQSDLESDDRIRRHVAAGAELHHPTTGEGWSGDMQGKVISPREQNASALGPESEVYPPNPARPNAESARRTDGNHATSRTPSELSSPTRQKLDSPRIVVKTAEGIREVEPYRSPSRVSPRNGEADDVLADKKRASSSASPGKRTNPAVTASKPAAKDEKRRKAHETTQETEEESKVEGGPLYKAKTTITSSHRDEERERARRNGQKRAMLQAEASEEKTEQWQAERTDDGRICEREKAYALTKPNTKQKALLDAKDAAKQGVSRLPGEGRVEVRESQKNFDVDGSAKREAKRRVLLKAEVAKQLKQGSSDLAPEEVEPDQTEEMARRGATKRAMIEAILSKETKASRSSVKETTHESDERDRAADGDTARRREKQRALLKANAAAEGETPQTADHRNKVDEKKRRREAGDHGTARNEAERRAMLRAVAGDGPACKIRMQYREDRSRTSVTDEDKDRARREAKRKALMEAKATAESRTSRSYQQDIGSQNDERRVNIYYEGETKKADRRKILIEDDEALERPKARLTANDKPKLEEVRSRGADVRSQGFEDWDAAVKQEKQKMMAASEPEKMRGCGGPDSLLKPTEATTTHDRVTRSRNDAAQDLGRYTDMRTSMKKDGRPIDPAAKKDKVDHAQALSQAIGGDPKSGHLTWSKCLVSLATCIDLANRLLSHLMASRSGKRGSQLSPILVEVLPRLLSSLLMQMDIVETMREVFGDDHSDSMGEFAKHLKIIKGCLQDQRHPIGELGRDADIQELEEGAMRTFQAGSLQVVLDHLLHFGRYLTPQILINLRELAEEWGRDELSMPSVFHAIITAQREVAIIQKQTAKERNEQQPQELGGIVIVLEQVRYLALERLKADRGCEIQLLDLLSSEQERRPPPKSLHQQLPASDRGKAVSLSRDPQTLPARAGTRDPSRSRPMETSKPLLEAEHGNASRGDERRDKKHTGFKEKISDLAEKVGDKMTSTHHTQPERMRHTTPPTSPQGLTIITEEADQPVETSRGIRGQTADDVHPATKGPDLHLPAATQDFLEATQDFLEAGQRHPPTRSSKPKGSKNVKLTPARIVKTTDVTGTHRGRPSWSSESHYSDDLSDGTIESDEGAGELLATADSGPAPAGVHGIGERQDRYHMENEEQSPDDDQVREAEDVLLNGETAKVKKEHKTLRKKREEEGKE